MSLHCAISQSYISCVLGEARGRVRKSGEFDWGPRALEVTGVGNVLSILN